MNPKVNFTSDEHNTLSFTLSGCNVSLANAIRRTILSDIPQVVFKTTPFEENKVVIHSNTSNLNNEVLKQRLSCIPIHIKDYENFPYKNYMMELNIENITDTLLVVTSNDFVIIDKNTNKALSKEKMREIFPPNEYTGQYIDFVRLKPKLTDDLPGEKIHLTADFTIGTAKEDGMFNVVSTCSYGFTVDDVARDNVLEKKKQQWKDEGKSKEEIEFECKNWKLLDGMRYTVKDSYDFEIQTVGVYTNNEILDKACDILIHKLDKLDDIIEKDELTINKSHNTMNNCYDVVLENEDYTLGKILEYLLYTKFYETKVLTFCGFKKMHPHDSDSIMRLAYTDVVDTSYIKGNVKVAIEEAKQFFTKTKKELLKLVKN
jgi:DNA-directed RNA polymerase alpha subunit